MTTPAELADLPVLTQVVLACGYVTYRLAYRGEHAHRKIIDVIFGTIAFSLIATGVFVLAKEFFKESRMIDFGAGVIALIFALVIGMAFRKWGYLFAKLMRKLNISWSSDRPSVLDVITQDTSHPVSQIAVELEDGTWLLCDGAHKFANAPFGPYLLGSDGSVALYLTHVEDPSGLNKEMKTTIHENGGHCLTHIQASKIRQLRIRYI